MASVSCPTAPDAPAFELDLIGPASTSYAESLVSELAFARTRPIACGLVGRLEKSELLRRLAAYDAAVLLLKRDEPFGYAWLEAAAVGLPVVVTKGLAVAEAFPNRLPAVRQRSRRCRRGRIGTSLVHIASRLARAGRAVAWPSPRTRLRHGTVVRPRYEAILQTARPPRVATDCDSLLASVLTCDAFGLAQDDWSAQ